MYIWSTGIQVQSLSVSYWVIYFKSYIKDRFIWMVACTLYRGINMIGEHKDCNFSLSLRDNWHITPFTYNTSTHMILLPNSKRINPNLKWIMESLTHEFLHKLLHEFIDLYTCCKLENIDKRMSNQMRPEFIISSLG